MLLLYSVQYYCFELVRHHGASSTPSLLHRRIRTACPSRSLATNKSEAGDRRERQLCAAAAVVTARKPRNSLTSIPLDDFWKRGLGLRRDGQVPEHHPLSTGAMVHGTQGMMANEHPTRSPCTFNTWVNVATLL